MASGGMAPPSYDESMAHQQVPPDYMNGVAAPTAPVLGTPAPGPAYPELQPQQPGAQYHYQQPPMPTCQPNTMPPQPQWQQPGTAAPFHPPPAGMPPYPVPPPQPGQVPPPGPFPQTAPTIEAPNYESERLNETQINDILQTYAKKKSWFFQKPNIKRDFTLQKYNTDYRVRYKLASFVESRKLDQRTEKIRPPAKPVELPPITDLWSYDIQPDAHMKQHVKERVLRSTIEKCSQCFGLRDHKCTHCNGVGKNECRACQLGKLVNDAGVVSRCMDCRGTGFVRCNSCNASGKVSCRECNGVGALRYLTVLLATFTKEEAYYLCGPEVGVKDKNLQKVTGLLMFSHELPRLTPPAPHPEYPELANEAGLLLNSHESKFGQKADCRILSQKQTIVFVPVTFVNALYKPKKKVYDFWVYGTERQVHCPDYGSCSIL